MKDARVKFLFDKFFKNLTCAYLFKNLFCSVTKNLELSLI